MKMNTVILTGLVLLFALLIFGCTQSQPKVVTPNYDFLNVGAHNAPEDCWISFEGKVYDITPLTSVLPEGATSKLIDLCGSNATNTFSQAGSTKVPDSEYLIGNLIE